MWVAVLTLILVLVIWNHNRQAIQQLKEDPQGTVTPITDPLNRNNAEDLEKEYERIAEELRQEQRRGIGHINPGDAIKPPPGKLPPEHPLPK